MEHLLNIHPFPAGAESNGFTAALASALAFALGFDDDTPYWCAPKSKWCTGCGECGSASRKSHHQEALYHALLMTSGLAFTFDYPEDDSVGFHTTPGVSAGWRWDEPFVAGIMDAAGFGYERFRNMPPERLRGRIMSAIDAGLPALAANHGIWTDETEWARCWNVVCGYSEDGVYVMRHGGAVEAVTEHVYEDWIFPGQKAPRKYTFSDILRRIYGILTHRSHAELEREVYADIEGVTPENSVATVYKLLGINGVTIESRWHAGEAFCSPHNLWHEICTDGAAYEYLREKMFPLYIGGEGKDTHAAGWKIWGALGVGPETGYMPTEESFRRVLQPEVRKELKQQFRQIFENDRAAANFISSML